MCCCVRLRFLCAWLCARVGMSIYYVSEKRRNSTLPNNKGIIHVLLSCLTCKLLRSEFPQICNKFKTADHTLYKASGDTSGNMVGSRECQHTRRWKSNDQTSAVSKWWSSDFYIVPWLSQLIKKDFTSLNMYFFLNAEYYTYPILVTFTSTLTFIIFILLVSQIQDISLTFWYY